MSRMRNARLLVILALLREADHERGNKLLRVDIDYCASLAISMHAAASQVPAIAPRRGMHEL